MIGIICAIDSEIAPYLGAISNVRKSEAAKLNIYEGILEKKPVVVIHSGVCKVNASIAAHILIHTYNAKCIIVSGTAGGMDKRLKIGDVVIAAEAAYHDVESHNLTKHPPYLNTPFFKADAALLGLCKNIFLSDKIFFGRIVTGEVFISVEGRAAIIKKYNPLCVDMETAAVAHVCHMYSVPFIAVRTISDTEEEVGVPSFLKNVIKASEQSFKIVNKLIGELE